MEMVCIGIAWIGGVLCGTGIAIGTTGNVFHDRSLRNWGGFCIGVGGTLSVAALIFI